MEVVILPPLASRPAASQPAVMVASPLPSKLITPQGKLGRSRLLRGLPSHTWCSTRITEHTPKASPPPSTASPSPTTARTPPPAPTPSPAAPPAHILFPLR